MNAQDKHPAPGTDPQPTPTAALADEPSGFVGDIEQEMDSQNALRSENSFSDLTPIYVSHSGHARLFSARRYGKLHTLKCLKEDFLLLQFSICIFKCSKILLTITEMITVQICNIHCK